MKLQQQPFVVFGKDVHRGRMVLTVFLGGCLLVALADAFLIVLLRYWQVSASVSSGVVSGLNVGLTMGLLQYLNSLLLKGRLPWLLKRQGALSADAPSDSTSLPP